MNVLHVVGARPNFMKAAPVLHALAKRSSIDQILVHTGQHYDANMSDVFFRELGMPSPDFNLNVGSGTHAQQTAQIMSKFEPIVTDCKPDMVVVYGDVNSTVATALVSAKLGIKIAHVEAGLRSFDWSMPEEINRVVTDRLADILLTPSEDADCNLKREGVSEDRIHRVGNVMIDSLVRLLPGTKRISSNGYPSRYALCTLHRPSNVDDLQSLMKLLNALLAINQSIPVVFPVHPRTRKRIADSGIDIGSLHLTEPLPYIE